MLIGLAKALILLLQVILSVFRNIGVGVEKLLSFVFFETGRYRLIMLYRLMGYGFSVKRPLLALLVVLIAMMVSLGFGFENGFALNLSWDGVCNAFSRLSCSISTLIPLLDSPKSCDGFQTIPVLTEVLKFLGYTLTFLVGLALRNHLKMK